MNKCIYAGGLVRERGRETEGEGQREKDRERERERGGRKKEIVFFSEKERSMRVCFRCRCR